MATKNPQQQITGTAVIPDGFVRCRILSPHVRYINGTPCMLTEGLFEITLPYDSDTKKGIERGWLEVVASAGQVHVVVYQI